MFDEPNRIDSMSQLFKEIPAEFLRDYLDKLTGDNAALLTAGNINLYNSSVVSCRFAFDLTFRPVAICFIRPQRPVLRFIEKNEYFTLCYFPQEHRHILDYFGSKPGSSGKKFEPKDTASGSIYYPQARLLLECRKIFNLELILSKEIQTILAREKAREIYPGGESPRMYLGEIEHCRMSMQGLLEK